MTFATANSDYWPAGNYNRSCRDCPLRRMFLIVEKYLSKDHMLAIQPWCWHCGDEDCNKYSRNQLATERNTQKPSSWHSDFMT